ncbi:Big map kinase/bmk [Zea mays]|uniref:Big map kinase/bmk n=1 Tax=Zea mays TaxID=4577 RepID=A0A1D6KKN6_MAIZE|nr:Big map kinase/bmk [Zea mays]
MILILWLVSFVGMLFNFLTLVYIEHLISGCECHESDTQQTTNSGTPLLFSAVNCWLKCMLLEPYNQTDHPECKSRPDSGLSAITELDPGYITAKRTIVTASTQIIEGAYPTEGCTNKAVRGDQCDNCRHMLNPTELIDPKCKVRNEKARRYLSSMRKKDPVPFSQKFPSADPLALKLLEKLLAFDPKDRLTAEEALRDPYFKGLAGVEREPSYQPIRKVEFDFEHKRMSNAVDQFKKQFSHLEESGGNDPSVPTDRKHASLLRTTVVQSNPIPAKEQPLAVSSRVRPVSDDSCKNPWEKASGPRNVTRTSLTPQGLQAQAGSVRVNGPVTDSRYPAHQQIPQAYGYRQMPARLDSTNPSQAMGGYTLQSQKETLFEELPF